MAKVSVIIPTYNEKESLADCIESLGKQTIDDFEIIVVDDGSTDNTESIVRNLKSQISNLKSLTQGHAGAGAARNLGAKYANGDVLVFIDADMTFDKDFLKNLVKPIESEQTRGVFSKEEIVSNWDNVWARCWNINEGWEEKRRHSKNYPDRQPVFRAILKSEFDRVGGFTPGGYNDDWSLSRKLGYEAENGGQFFSPKAQFFHKNPSTLSEVFAQARWIGKRRYKLGFVGNLIALVRSSLPVSFLVGLYKSFAVLNFRFLIFKIIYDFGVFIGILEYLITGVGSK